MTQLRRIIGILAALFIVLNSPTETRAGDDEVEVQIYAIRATTANKDVSPELKDMAAKLGKEFKYTGFKLEKKATGKVKIDKPFEAELIEGYSAQVTPREFKDERAKMCMRVTHRDGEKTKQKVKTDLTTERGKFVLVGVEKLSDDEYLIIAAAVR